MNKLQFTEILNNPESVNEVTLSGIKEIIEEYPFFQIGRMLWLKNLHKLDSIKYNSELKSSAAYIADRTKLFQLINNINKDNDNNLVVDEVEDIKIKEVVTEEVNIEENKTSDIADKQPEPKETQIQKDVSTPVTAIDNYLKASDDFIDEDNTLYNFKPRIVLEEQANNEIQDIVLPAADLLDYEMTSSSSYSLPSMGQIEEVTTDDSRSFSDWLHVMHYSSPKTEEEEKKQPKKKGIDLIENFLSSNPQIIPDPAKKAKDVDLSDKNIDAEEDILSETLAKIHIKQGNKSKAIAIFEKLRLKYPEKSAYFARRIKKLKEN